MTQRLWADPASVVLFTDCQRDAMLPMERLISARVGTLSKPMTITLKEKLVVPPSVQRQAHLKAGTQLEFKATPGIITITGKPPVAVNEYTPEQRRIIDARLALADEDVKKGRVYGPFTAKEATGFLRAELKARAKKPKRPR